MEKSHAIAYATIALNELGYDNQAIETITNRMLAKIEHYSVEEVESRADEILFAENKGL